MMLQMDEAQVLQAVERARAIQHEVSRLQLENREALRLNRAGLKRLTAILEAAEDIAQGLDLDRRAARQAVATRYSGERVLPADRD